MEIAGQAQVQEGQAAQPVLECRGTWELGPETEGTVSRDRNLRQESNRHRLSQPNRPLGPLRVASRGPLSGGKEEGLA